MKNKDKKFSDLLKDKRFDVDADQYQMATALGMKERMYQHYERGDFDETTSVRRDKYLRKLALITKENLPPKKPKAQSVSEPEAQYRKGKGNIIHIPLHAWGGFLRGYEDTVFMDSLEHYEMPGIVGKHFSWDVKGFSMYKKGHELSAKPGDRIFAIPKDGISDLSKGEAYMIQSVDGLTYKIFDRIEGNKAYFNALNEEEEGVVCPLKEIKGIYFVDYILKKP